MERLKNVHARVRELVESNVFVDQPWESIRKKFLWAGGLRDLPNAAPGNVRFFFNKESQKYSISNHAGNHLNFSRVSTIFQIVIFLIKGLHWTFV
jgi:hypothetical protein